MPDPYVYPGTDVLRNRLGIHDAGELAAVERAATAQRLTELDRWPLEGQLDLEHLRAIHALVFGDVYEWAGRLRTVEIDKRLPFCRSDALESEGRRIFAALAAEKRLVGLDRQMFVVRLAERGPDH